MKTIGLLGGMSWESTVSYYRIVNTVVKERLGGLHSARCLLYSVDFQEIEACQSAGDWDRSALLLGAAAQNLEKGGADFIVICTNTMHKVAPQIGERVRIPILHIAEATAEELERRLEDCDKPITVAVMGCVVNGPGEASAADIGVAGGKGEGLIFRHGEVLYKVAQEKLLDALLEEIEKL